ncbi:MAG: hypothetical protein M1826_001608 [Phylliscum demangeonii]|nr:MAG: hypothetical protein M1826_001608 [Phylliscum demangeonii]
MLALSSSPKGPRSCTAHVLPCRINHTGPVNASERFWSAADDADGLLTASFRGRRLRARVVRPPQGYQGAVLVKTKRRPDQERHATTGSVEREEEGEEDDKGMLQARAAFEEIVCWEHEAQPDPMTDSYAKGIEGWIGLAERMHSWPEEDSERAADTMAGQEVDVPPAASDQMDATTADATTAEFSR